MKIINFEISKKLNDLWLLENIETEYHYNAFYIWDDTFEDKDYEWKVWINKFNKYKDSIKTLTLEEAKTFVYHKCEEEVYNYINQYSREEIFYFGIEDIENMLEYLLENNLLTK